MNNIFIDIPASVLIKRFVFVLFLVFLIYLAYSVRESLTVMAIAAFLALAVNKPVTKLTYYLPFGGRKLSAMAVFVLVGLVVVIVMSLIVPLVFNQGQELAGAVPRYIEQLRSGDTAFSRLILRYDVIGYLETFVTNIAAGLVGSVGILIDFTARLLSNLVVFLFTIVLAFLMAVEGPAWLKAMERNLPDSIRNEASDLISRMYKAVTGFVNGQLIITSIASLTTLVVLTVAGMPAPLSLAAVIWVTGLIPLIGNTLGAIVVIAVALSQSLLLAVILSIYYIIYQQVENNVFEPIVQSRTIKMTPLMVLLSAMIGIHLAGFLGALLAIPAGACVKIALNYALSFRDEREMANEA